MIWVKKVKKMLSNTEMFGLSIQQNLASSKPQGKYGSAPEHHFTQNSKTFIVEHWPECCLFSHSECKSATKGATAPKPRILVGLPGRDGIINKVLDQSMDQSEHLVIGSLC